MNILVTICGRGGSKGIPGKNIRVLDGIPLIGYSIQHAQEFAKSRPDVDILLSTDDPEIKSIAKEFGLQTAYRRPSELAGDTIGKIAVLKHGLDYQEQLTGKRYEILLDLDITSPIRTQQDLEYGLARLTAIPEAINIFSVSKPHRNPYFNVVELKKDGFCKLVCPSDIKSRQTAPQVFDMNASFYFYRRAFFEGDYSTPITPQSLHYLMDHICFDLDEPMDFEYMNFLLKQGIINLKT